MPGNHKTIVQGVMLKERKLSVSTRGTMIQLLLFTENVYIGHTICLRAMIAHEYLMES